MRKSSILFILSGRAICMKTHEVAFSIASNNSPIVEVGRPEIRTQQEAFPLEGADKISFPGPRRVDGVASNSQHVKSLGAQIAEQGRRFFLKLNILVSFMLASSMCCCFLYRKGLLKCGIFWCRERRTRQEAALVSW